MLNEAIVSCRRCPRLVAWREQVAREKRRAYRDDEYWGRPVVGFGDRNARLFILGLAPAAHGANRTGRMFTGDSSGNTLMAALHRAGFASLPTSRRPDDGLELKDAFITALARCAPPANRPTAAEFANCRPFWTSELALMPNVRVVWALGQLAFDHYQRWMREQGVETPRVKFGHGAMVEYPNPHPILIASYHPSRQNTQTGRLTPVMLDDILKQVREWIAVSPCLPHDGSA
ncbi:MAG: uracil-DNA glycosylase [Chloroflexi bacterium]|nr:uracil-DNA glycosylase [Chloroflexota bacterium]